MKRGTMATRMLAGAACAVLLAACTGSEPAEPSAQDDPAPQVEVVDRTAEEEPASDATNEAEKNEEAADAGFDASAPVVDATSSHGVTVTAPEGFLDTPAYAAVEAEISALEAAGHSVSVRMVDLATGRGLTYNADVARYPASAIKALFCASLLEAHGGSAGMAQTVADCLINSSNDAYKTLIDTFGLATFAQWLADHGAPSAVESARTHYYPDITASDLANAWCEIWRYGTSGEPGADELAGYLSQTANTPIATVLRGEHEVWSKAGWYPADENNLTSTNDAGVVFADGGAYVLVVMTDLSANLDGLTPLVAALDGAHETMCPPA